MNTQSVSELPIEKYNRELHELWERARAMSKLSIQDLIETIVSFAAHVGPYYQQVGLHEAGNKMLKQLKEELASRYHQA